VLSVLLVGMGAALGREGAPKQFGAVLANGLADKAQLTDEQRRLPVACGAGAGMAAAYGVPLGGALFALEVLRGVLALRLILPALLACMRLAPPHRTHHLVGHSWIGVHRISANSRKWQGHIATRLQQ
jgi:H+/Cl- antiporter ClcA